MDYKHEIEKGEALFANGQIDQAKGIFESILKDQPENHEALNNLGVIYHTRGNVKEAEGYFLKAVEAKEDYLDALLNLSNLYQNEKRWEEASVQLEKCITINDQNPNLYNQLGMVCLEMGDTEKARSVLARSIDLNPDQEAVRDSLNALEKKDEAQKIEVSEKTLNILFVQEAPCIRNYKMATALRSRGHRVSLAYTKARLSQMYKGLSDDVYDECIQLKSHRHLWDLSKNYDIVHCHNEPDVLTVAALAGDAPVVHDTHDLISLRANADPNLSYFEGVANRGATGRVYTTPYQLEEAKKLYGIKGPSLVFYNYASEADLPERFLPKLSEQDGHVHIVYEGGIGGNGHRDFSSLFIELGNQGIHIHIYPTFYDQEIAKYFSGYQNIHYCRPLSPKEVMQEMTQYDFGIIPFNLEKGNRRFLDSTIANKLFEYLAAGLPVIASSLKSYINYFERNPVGITFESSEAIINNIAKLKQIAKRTDFSTQIFTFESKIAMLEQFYHGVVTNSLPVRTDEKSKEAFAARQHWKERGILTCYFKEGKQSATIVDVIKKLRQYEKIESVLEFGCNVGRNLYCLQREVGGLDLLGLDINEAAINAGRQHYQLPLSVGGEAELKKMEDGAFDVVFTVSVLDHIPQVDDVLKELLRVTQKYFVAVEPFIGVDQNAKGCATADFSYFWDYPRLFAKFGAEVVHHEPCPLSAEGLGPFYQLYIVKPPRRQDRIESKPKAGKVNIEEIQDGNEWNALVRQSPYAFYSHSAEYDEFVFDGVLKKIKISIDDEIYIVPLEIKNGIACSFSKYYGGIIPINGYEYITKAFDVLCQVVRNSGLSGLHLSYIQQPEYEFVKILEAYISRKGGKKIDMGGWNYASIAYVDRPHEEIWKNVYSAKTRNMIRKAKKNGVECRIINILDHVEDAVDCTLSKLVRHGSNLPDYYYNTKLFRETMERGQKIFGDNMISFGAFLDGTMIAYINTFVRCREAFATNMLSHADFLKAAPNNVIFDFMIEYYTKKEGVRWIMYPFETLESVDRFKHSMGFEPVTVHRWLVEFATVPKNVREALASEPLIYTERDHIKRIPIPEG